MIYLLNIIYLAIIQAFTALCNMKFIQMAIIWFFLIIIQN